MAEALYPVSGSKIYIGNKVNAKGEVDIDDFANADWTEIDGWANAGELGDTQDVGEQALINQRRVRKFKTTLNGGTMDNQFVPIATDPGQQKFKRAIQDCQPYQFKVEWGADCVPENEVGITAADPAVVTWTNHGFSDGQPISFTEDGSTLPTGLTADTVYYVVNATTDTFEVAATEGGTPIDTDGGTTVTDGIIASAPPAGMTDYFYGLALPGARSGGGAADVHLRSWSIAVDSNIVEV